MAGRLKPWLEMLGSLCGAKTRKGTPCRMMPELNGRCRLHGGYSTGPRTPEGKRRAAEGLRKLPYCGVTNTKGKPCRRRVSPSKTGSLYCNYHRQEKQLEAAAQEVQSWSRCTKNVPEIGASEDK